MTFVRTIVNSDTLENVVSIPDELKHQDVELLIFPAREAFHKSNNTFNPDDYAGILHIKNIEQEISSLRSEWERF